jgi:hypothetical protein
VQCLTPLQSEISDVFFTFFLTYPHTNRSGVIVIRLSSKNFSIFAVAKLVKKIVSPLSPGLPSSKFLSELMTPHLQSLGVGKSAD